MLKINLTPKNEKIRDILEKNQIFILISSMYLIIGLSLILYNPHTINADGVSYINIAQEYFNGHYFSAINRYWSPLFSWILIPYIHIFGNNPFQSLFAAKILSLTAGLFTLIGFRLLLNRFEINEKIANIALIALIPELIYFSFRWVTPDLLLTCILVFYLVLIFNRNYPNKPSFAILCGVLGSLAYLTKSYGFAFFIASFLIFNLFYFIKNRTKRSNILKNTFLGLGIFLLISGVWIGVMDSKYGYITLGSSCQFNIDLTSSNHITDSFGGTGLSDIPNKYAVSSWEDPSTLQPIIVQRNLNNLIYHRIMIVWNNFFVFLGIIESFSFLAIAIIIASFIYLIKIKNNKIKNNITALLLVLFIFSGGYILIFMEGRYLILDCIIILLLGCYLLNNLFNKYNLSNMFKTGVLIIFALSFILTPLIITYLDIDNGQEVYGLVPSLEKYGVKGNIASSKLTNYDPHYLAYYLNAHYYGVTKENESLNDLEIELKSKNIDYYLVWQNPDTNNTDLPYPEISNGEISFLRIYKIPYG
jgi:hypothetical protein